LHTVGADISQEVFEMKKREEYSAVDWQLLHPHQRARIIQAEGDELAGRNTLQIRAEDGIGVIHLDRATGKPVEPPLARRMGTV
jgi:hypothetical protein